MKKLACISCQSEVDEKALFCSQCGQQIKCKSCQELILASAKYCMNCGVTVNKNQEDISKSLAGINTIKLRESKEERYYEIEFTNDIGKEIKEAITDILKNKSYWNEEDGLITGEMVTNNQPIIAAETQATIKTSEISALDEIVPPDEYPHLNDLEINLDCRENEWLLIYAFYLSDFGSSTFSKDKVWNLYKEKRKTETRFKNLGTNWKSLFKKHVSTLRDNEFKFTAQGLEKVRQLLNPVQRSKSTKTGKRNNSIDWEKGIGPRSQVTSRKATASNIVQEAFDVYQTEEKESLESFFIRKRPGNGNPNRIITIAYYITKINGKKYFTEGNIDFAYRILNLAGKPVHLKQVIINLKNDKVWFQRVAEDNGSGWKLTRQAEIYVEERLPQFF